MRRLFTFALVTAATLSMASCNEVQQEEIRPDGLIQISVAQEGDATRASSETTVYGSEATINKLEVFVFDASGTLDAHKDFGTATSGVIECKAGTGKTVCVVANGPATLAGVTTLTEYNNISIDLPSLNRPANGFVMSGMQTGVSITKNTTTPIAISISRLVSRVQLVSISNALASSFGPVTINSVMLTNVVGNQNLAGNAAVNTWYNPMGRKNESTLNTTHIVDGYSYVSTAKDVTFSAVSSVVLTAGSSHNTKYRFYGFPNATTVDTEGFSATMTPRFTRLVITATILGKKYYYPVSIATPSRNKTYDVTVTLLHLGSTDPDALLATGTASVNVTVNGWTSGAPINENL